MMREKIRQLAFSLRAVEHARYAWIADKAARQGYSFERAEELSYAAFWPQMYFIIEGIVEAVEDEDDLK